jgi:hypothetical protein
MIDRSAIPSTLQHAMKDRTLINCRSGHLAGYFHQLQVRTFQPLAIVWVAPGLWFNLGIFMLLYIL